MKTKQLIKKTLITLIFGLFGLYGFAKTDNNLIYDTEEIDGVMVSQTVYKQNDGLLAKYQKYTYKYDDNYRVVKNTSYKWNGNSWENDMCICHEYKDKTTQTTYYKWNNKTNEYILQPKMTLITNNY